MITIRDLRFSYPDGRIAIDGFSLEVNQGETVGIIGPNGAGKTSLFLCMTGVLRSSPGKISVAGLDPALPTDRKELPKKIGIVFQNSDDQLFCSTVEDDVAFGPMNLKLPASEIKERVEESLQKMKLADHRDRVPHHLSGGEKRRAAIAGILAMRPEIFLLDEPSMFLDVRGRRELINVINGIPGTKVIASHDLPLIRDTSSRIIIMEAGRIVAEGPKEILRDGVLLEKYGLEAI